MNYEDKVLLNSVMSKLCEWEDKIQDVYGHMNKLEQLIIDNFGDPRDDILDYEILKARIERLEHLIAPKLVKS